MHNKTINIALNFNDDYMLPALVSIYSLFNSNKEENIHVYILESNICEANKNKILKLTSIFDHKTIEFVKVDRDLLKKFPLTERRKEIPYETYYKIFLAEKLTNIDKIIYIDSDVLVVDEIRSLWDTDVEEMYCAGVFDGFIEFDDSGHKESVLKMTENAQYINWGLAVMNLKKIREERKTEEAINLAEKYETLKYVDQDILNQVFQGGIKYIDMMYNFAGWNMRTYPDRINTAKILHFTGRKKPWHVNNYEHPYFNIYQEYIFKIEAFEISNFYNLQNYINKFIEDNYKIQQLESELKKLKPSFWSYIKSLKNVLVKLKKKFQL